MKQQRFYIEADYYVQQEKARSLRPLPTYPNIQVSEEYAMKHLVLVMGQFPHRGEQ